MTPPNLNDLIRAQLLGHELPPEERATRPEGDIDAGKPDAPRRFEWVYGPDGQRYLAEPLHPNFNSKGPNNE